MARYKNGINGPVSGKIGNVVAASWRGIDYFRSLAEYTDNPTEKQILQRLKFALVNGWLKPLREIIWIGFQFFTGSKTPMNGCVSYHLREALIGEGPDYTIDFSKAVFSRGELLVSLIRELICLVDGILNVKWENGPETAFSKPDDQATFIVYNTSKNTFVTFKDVAVREAQEVNLKMPKKHMGNEVHIWMQYVNAAGDGVSTSVYVGQAIPVA
ncbi:DUF6266 family protein [Pedobacter frigoris]|uniref:DUF6266 family protein n=1 Tax=Pedobacter frigoris TaxID=2571272 RepID=UPI00292DD232|nr:DUF6266 family protein [Pedobacter frigoris]